MKRAALMLCLMAGLMTSGCVFHHETVREREPENERPDDVAAGDAGTAR